jgi:hypothetical protein
MTYTRALVLATVCAAAGFATPLPAAADSMDGALACLQDAAQTGAPLGACVNDAQADCLGLDPGSSEGILCFQTTKARWGALITERMAEIEATAPDEIRQIAGIEVKYDLQINLLQCDRMEELSLVSRNPDTTTLHARAACESSAVGLSWVRLMARSGGVEPAKP